MGTYGDGQGKFSLPGGFTSIGELRKTVLNHYGQICQTAGLSETNETVSVGIIDSIYDPGEKFRESNSVGRTVDLLPAERANKNNVDTDLIDGVEHDSTGHGSIVTAILLAASYNIEFNFYRVTQPAERGFVLQRHFQNALGMAHLEHDVDVINLSIGNDHSNDGNTDCGTNLPCKINEATQMAIDDGISVVAAAGNKQQFDSISCPAKTNDVICVGSFVSKCQARLDTDNPYSIGGKYLKPPNACWIERSDEVGSNEVFCSGQGCSPMHSCEEHRQNLSWEGNVDPMKNKPDVLAPTGIPVIWGVPQISVGTSWSTPFVTATVAEILASVRERNAEASPQLLRRGIIEGANQLDDGTEKLFCSADSWRYVYDELGLESPI